MFCLEIGNVPVLVTILQDYGCSSKLAGLLLWVITFIRMSYVVPHKQHAYSRERAAALSLEPPPALTDPTSLK